MLAQLVKIVLVGLPGSGDQLAGRVGKKVAVMEVYHQVHPGGLYLSGHLHHVFLAAPPPVRVHPYAKADGIEAAVFEHVQKGSLGTVFFLELYPALFHLGGPGDIGPFHKGRFRLRRRSGGRRRCGCRRGLRLHLAASSAGEGSQKGSKEKQFLHSRKLLKYRHISFMLPLVTRLRPQVRNKWFV